MKGTIIDENMNRAQGYSNFTILFPSPASLNYYLLTTKMIPFPQSPEIKTNEQIRRHKMVLEQLRSYLKIDISELYRLP